MILLWIQAAATAAPLPAHSAGPQCYTSVPPALVGSWLPIGVAPTCCSKCDPHGSYGLLMPTFYYAELIVSDSDSGFIAPTEKRKIVLNGRGRKTSPPLLKATTEYSQQRHAEFLDDRFDSHLNNAPEQQTYDWLYHLFDGYQNGNWADDDDYYHSKDVTIDSDYERARTKTYGDEPVIEPDDVVSDLNLEDAPRAMASGGGNSAAFNSRPSAQPTANVFEEEGGTQNTAPGFLAMKTYEHTESSTRTRVLCGQCVSQEQCQQLGRTINIWHHTCT